MCSSAQGRTSHSGIWAMPGGPIGLKCDFCVKKYNFGFFYDFARVGSVAYSRIPPRSALHKYPYTYSHRYWLGITSRNIPKCISASETCVHIINIEVKFTHKIY